MGRWSIQTSAWRGTFNDTAVHPVESISNEVAAMQRQIASRAEKLYETLVSGQPLDH